jgi:transcriptional regulator GlxA family with amidase domain
MQLPNWSVETLADRVSMSRSKFAAKFKRLVKESPLAYLSRLRLNIAAVLVVDTDLTVGEISHRVGYEAETAFSSAFKKGAARLRGCTAVSSDSRILNWQIGQPLYK